MLPPVCESRQCRFEDHAGRHVCHCRRAGPASIRNVGAGPKRKRETLLGMIDPRRSPLARCESNVWGLLRFWSDGEAQWRLLDCVGVDFHCAETKMKFRGLIIGVAAGLDEVFSVRLALPMYRLLHLAMEG